MKRLFLSIKKGEELRFLGHLDYLRTMERAIVRSGLPMAFSEGFNPHMKLAFDAALAVGVTADPLYMEIRLEKDWTVKQVRDALVPQLPKGMEIHHIVEADLSWPKLSNFFNEDAYEMEGPALEGASLEEARRQIDTFNSLPSFLYTRVTPKKTREMDVKPMILSPMAVDIRSGRAYLTFSLVRSHTGTVQPKDVWKMLAESFQLPWTEGEFICSRTGAYRNIDGKRYTPLDKKAFDAFVKGGK